MRYLERPWETQGRPSCVQIIACAWRNFEQSQKFLAYRFDSQSLHRNMWDQEKHQVRPWDAPATYKPFHRIALKVDGMLSLFLSVRGQLVRSMLSTVVHIVHFYWRILKTVFTEFQANNILFYLFEYSPQSRIAASHQK